MRAATDPDTEPARLGKPLPFHIPDREFGLRNLEAHGSGLVWFQVDARKALQRSLGGLDAGCVLMEIELSHFISFTLARIGDLDAHPHRIVRAGRRSLGHKVCIAEGRIAKAEAEWKESLSTTTD